MQDMEYTEDELKVINFFVEDCMPAFLEFIKQDSQQQEKGEQTK